ncbi:MAG: decarboxylating 6-phosphogluconate dehydrogenase [Acidimicrobiia bacterium]|nr:decarboxylating 6-phosphogluconate dehydrogenase [Acidimicrobiia bacterium]
MDIGMIGLGKMGGNMADRLVRDGHRVVGYDTNEEAAAESASEGVEIADDVADLVRALARPRVVWIMVPAGEITDAVIDGLRPHLDEGDVVVDGGNSNYKDTLRRAESLATDGIHLVDVGTSGGIWGLTEGYSMMVGATDEALELVAPAVETLAPGDEEGWGHVGKPGSGHFVKMIHNGIEYGLMQAYAEGFAIMRAKEEFDLDLGQVADIWRYGSVVRSWLLDLTGRALAEGSELEGIDPWVPDSGEGRWTVFEAIDLDVAAPVISMSLIRRLASRDEYEFSDRLLAALRNQFGGHAVRPSDQ